MITPPIATMTTENLDAILRPDGSVWIRIKIKPSLIADSVLKDGAIVKIEPEDRQKLVRLLCHDTQERDNKVDYSRCAGEPE